MYAKELLAALDAEQKNAAHQKERFPETKDESTAPVAGRPAGLPAAKMDEKQKAILMKLIKDYASRLPDDVAAVEMDRLREAGVDKIHFAYSLEADKPGKPYTYRVQGPTFIIEFLNVQADSANNPANHIHSSWRNIDYH